MDQNEAHFDAAPSLHHFEAAAAWSKISDNEVMNAQTEVFHGTWDGGGAWNRGGASNDGGAWNDDDAWDAFCTFNDCGA